MKKLPYNHITTMQEIYLAIVLNKLGINLF